MILFQITLGILIINGLGLWGSLFIKNERTAAKVCDYCLGMATMVFVINIVINAVSSFMYMFT